MCIILFSTAHPSYPFILLSNRDEFLDRPTKPAEWWDAPHSHVLGGRDAQRKERGTWLAITRQGRLAALTNFSDEGVEVAKDKSRGGVVNAFLAPLSEERESPPEFAKRLINDVGVHDVGGFSLLFGELHRPAEDGSRPGLSILSNRSASADTLSRVASASGETHGLSNSHFADSSWPKVVLGQELLNQAIHANTLHEGTRENLIEECFKILSLDTLPKHQGDEWDIYTRQFRNSIFIPMVGGPVVENNSAETIAASSSEMTAASDKGVIRKARSNYGTQKQTVVIVDAKGMVTFVERTLFNEIGKSDGGKDAERIYQFQIEGWSR